MPIPTRAAAVVGLGLLGMLSLAARPLIGQQSDPQVQRSAADAGQSARPAATSMAPSIIAGLNMQKVLSEYNRYKESSAKFESDSMQKRKELELLLAEAKQIAEKREQFGVGTPDYQTYSDQLADTQAKFEAQKQKIAADFAIRESNAVAEIYNDVRYIVEYVSKKNKISFVLQVGSSEKLTGENPDLVMSTVLQPVVYHDPAVDITDEVIYYLNDFHERRKAQQGGTAPAPATPAPAPAADGN